MSTRRRASVGDTPIITTTKDDLGLASFGISSITHMHEESEKENDKTAKKPLRFIVPTLPSVSKLRTAKQATSTSVATDYGTATSNIALNKLLNRGGRDDSSQHRRKHSLPKLTKNHQGIIYHGERTVLGKIGGTDLDKTSHDSRKNLQECLENRSVTQLLTDLNIPPGPDGT